ncbi:PucR family transcriptional regulator [Corynebacterium striatum]|uniref:PucR family transcriptional regulator n=1 Tax=Corynebacterium striatum TaxID=43770 RepID=UPI00101B6480|nr:PucR family transcriptional regulator [Corynebacterium striatum]
MSKPTVPNLARIQELADDIARQLQCSVEVTTPSINVIAASAQLGAVDSHRVASILERTPPPEPIPWMLSYGIQESSDPVRLPANAEYDMLPRVVIPLRHGPELVGHVWIIDEHALSDAALATVSPQLSTLTKLVDERDAYLATRAQQLGDLARDIVAGDESALAIARERDLLPRDGEVLIHRIDVDGDLVQLSMELARPLRRRPFLALDLHDSLIIVESPRDEQDTKTLIEEVASAALTAGTQIGARGSAPTARRARFMADVARLTGQPAMDWAVAGAWRALLGWDLSPATVRALSPDAALLLDAKRNSYWESLLCYFEHSRNVNDTAAALYIHRATLHYRLDRVREILGSAALEDGWRCAALYMALKLHAALNRRYNLSS